MFGNDFTRELAWNCDIIKVMANNNQSKKTRSTRRLSKAELEKKKKAIHRMIVTILISLVFSLCGFEIGGSRGLGLQLNPTVCWEFGLFGYFSDLFLPLCL